MTTREGRTLGISGHPPRAFTGSTMVGLVLTMCASLGLASPLRADVRDESCAVLPPGQPPEQELAEEASRRAIAAVTEALSSRNLTVLRMEDAQHRLLGGPHEGCNEIECGASAAEILAVDFVVLVSVWAPRGTPTSVVVTLIDAQGESVAGDTPADADTIEESARSALATAYDRWRASNSGRLVVRTVPPHAEIELDGRSLGRAPLERLVPAGAHRIAARRDRLAVEREIQVPARRVTELTLTLRAIEPNEAEADARAAGGEDSLAFSDWAVPVGVGAIGIGGTIAIAVPALSAATTGCAEPSEHGCAVSNRLAVGPTVGWAVLGATVALAGLTLLVLGVATDDGPSITVGLGPTYGSIEGRF